MDIDRLSTTLSASSRSALRSPGLTLLGVATLAVALGAATAAFSVVKGVLLDALPYQKPEQVVLVRESIPSISDELPITQGEYLDLQESHGAYSALALADLVFVTPLKEEAPRKISGARVTPNLFSLLGIRPFHGRLFSPADGTPGGPPVVVVSHRLWKTRFGGQTSAIGRPVELSVASRFGTSPGREALFTIIGVLPPGFRSPFENEDLWFPEQVTQANANRQRHAFFMVGRLKLGATLQQARTQASSVFAAADPGLPVHKRPGRSTMVERLPDYMVRNIRSGLLVLMAAVGLVLLIACANVASLEMTRAVTRERELALRAALGCNRRGIFGLTLLESLLVALFGGVLGLLVAEVLLRLVLALDPGGIPRLEDVGIDPYVLAVAFGLALLTGLVIGVVPAARAIRTDLQVVLRGGTRTGASRKELRLRSLLAIFEIALAAIVLVGAGLLIRSLESLEKGDQGFDPRGVLVGEVSLSSTKYPEGAQQEAFFRPALERLETLPGVASAALVNTLPLTGLNFATPFEIEGRKEDSGVLTADFRLVTSGYFTTLRIPVLSGRPFTSADIHDPPHVALVDKKFVDTFLRNSNPLEHQLRLRGPLMKFSQPIDIIGVVGNVRHDALSDELRPTFYLPSLQSATMSFVLRAQGQRPEMLARGVRSVIHSIDPRQPIEIRTFREIALDSIARPRFSAFVMMTLASLALLLAVVGMFATMRHSVVQRRRELGIQLALGAEPRRLLGGVLRRGLLLTVFAVFLGLIAARVVTRVLESQLYGVSRTDWRTFTAATIVLLVVAAVACWFPARAATKVDPLDTLRLD